MLFRSLFFIRSYEAASTGYLYALASLVCMVLAILSKESAYIFPLLLVVFLIAKRDLSRRRLGVLIPFFVTAVALFAYRWWLFGGIGGYRDPHTGQSQVLTLGFSTLKALALRLWTALYFPINWSKEPGAWAGGVDAAVHGSAGLAGSKPPLLCGGGFSARIRFDIGSSAASSAGHRVRVGELTAVVPSIRGLLHHGGRCR